MTSRLAASPFAAALVASSLLALAACGGGSDSTSSGPGGGDGGKGGAGTTTGSAGTGGAPGTGGAGASGGAGPSSTSSVGAGLPTSQESEPNNGDDKNELPFATRLQGVIGEVGDLDVFSVATEAGKFYRVRLVIPAGSKIVGHLTVIDDGRNGDKPGDDYVKLVSRPQEEPYLTFPAMGAGSHIVAVRDARTLANPEDPTSGSPQHTYEVVIEELEEAAVLATPATFPGTIQDLLRDPGDLRAHAFTAVQGDDAVVSLATPGTLDARLFVISKSTKDWIARNADGPNGKDPKIDAPLTEGGDAFIVVESELEEASDLTYTLTLTK